MDTKTAAENSLYIIFFSQLASLAASILTHSVPAFSVGMLCLMVGGGICGGICGRAVNLITGQPHDFGGGSELPPYSAFYWQTER